MPLPQKYKVNDDECIEFKRKAIARRDVAKALKEGEYKGLSAAIFVLWNIASLRLIMSIMESHYPFIGFAAHATG